MIGGYNPWYIQELKTRIANECVDKSIELGQGMAGDFADYRYAVGLLDGLRLASDIADQIKQEQDKA